MGGINEELQRGKVLLAGNAANNPKATLLLRATATALNKLEARVGSKLRRDYRGMVAGNPNAMLQVDVEQDGEEP